MPRPGGSTGQYGVGDVRDWHATPDVGVVVCHAVLHWVAGHDALLERWVGELPPGAHLAFQVPGNFTSPAYELIREVAALRGLVDLVPGRDVVRDVVGYASLLTGLGCEVDAWETTYIHQLPATGQDHPVLRWFEGTGLRAIRSTVDDDGWTAFRGELNPRLEAAYPARDGRVTTGDAREPNIVMFPFRRIFVVSRMR